MQIGGNAKRQMNFPHTLHFRIVRLVKMLFEQCKVRAPWKSENTKKKCYIHNTHFAHNFSWMQNCNRKIQWYNDEFPVVSSVPSRLNIKHARNENQSIQCTDFNAKKITLTVFHMLHFLCDSWVYFLFFFLFLTPFHFLFIFFLWSFAFIRLFVRLPINGYMVHIYQPKGVITIIL